MYSSKTVSQHFEIHLFHGGGGETDVTGLIKNKAIKIPLFIVFLLLFHLGT